MTVSPPIPHPPRRVPLLGDILGMDRARPNQKTMLQFDRLGPIYRRTILGAGDLTFEGSAALATQALDESRWERYQGRPLERLRVIANDGLFTARNGSDAWKVGHEVLSRGFTQEAMRDYHPLMLDAARRLNTHLGSATHHAHLEVLTNRAALDVIGRCGFGFGFWDSSQGDRFANALTRALAFSQSASVPIVGLLTQGRERKSFERDVAELHSVIDDVIDRRRKAPSPPQSTDLLSVMLASQELDDAAVRDQIITFLIAGHETTGNLLAFALFYLARNPAAIATIRAERTTAPLGYEDVSHLRYTRAVVNETLRLWPTAPGFFRSAKTETSLGSHTFEPGDWVFLLMLAVHRDETVWGPMASQFDAERFTRRLPTGSVYRPFGTGPRACIGRQFALHEATVFISEIVSTFDLIATDDGDSHPVVDENLTLRPRVELDIRAR